MILDRLFKRLALPDDEQALIANATENEARRLQRARRSFSLLSNVINFGLFIAAMFVLSTRGIAMGVAAVVLAEVLTVVTSLLLAFAARRSVRKTLNTIEDTRNRGIAPGES
jgi:hypothetical protein